MRLVQAIQFAATARVNYVSWHYHHWCYSAFVKMLSAAINNSFPCCLW